MNALCALLYFCEIHGPRTVFCTQAFHTRSPPPTSTTTSNPPTPVVSRPNSAGSAASRRHRQNEDHHDNADDPNVQSQPIGSASATATVPALTSTSSCPACTAQIPFITITNPDGSEWTQEAKGLYTRDDENLNVHYFGSRCPEDPQLYAALRHACVRSLSIEFCPGRDGPVLFGDDKNGYVLSYMFRLRDAQARGDLRFYSFIIFMTDRVYLAACWSFLVRIFRSMVVNLQAKAEVVYQKEKEAKERQQAIIGRRTSFGPSSPDQYLRNRRGTMSLRSLVDLLSIKDLYVHIHSQFSLILKVANRQRIEKVVQGRRTKHVVVSEYRHVESDEQESRDSLVPSMSSSTTITSIGTADTETTEENMVVMGIEVGVTEK